MGLPELWFLSDVASKAAHSQLTDLIQGRPIKLNQDEVVQQGDVKTSVVKCKNLDEVGSEYDLSLINVAEFLGISNIES